MPVRQSAIFLSLPCEVARRAFLVLEAYEDVVKVKMQLQSRMRVFDCSDTRFGDSVLPLAGLLENRKHEVRELRAYIEALAERCFLYREVRKLGGGALFWAFLVTRCNVSRFKTLQGLIAYLGVLKGKSKSGREFTYRNLTGRRFNKYLWGFRRRQGKLPEVKEAVAKLMDRIRREHPDYTEPHVKNLAWFKWSRDFLLPGYYWAAKRVCSRCPLKDKVTAEPHQG